MNYGTEKFYSLLKQKLMDWVWNNPKLLHKIKKRELEFLFEFDTQRGLSIDLRRFEQDFYKATFYPPDEKKQHIDEFVRKVCKVIHKNMNSSGRNDLTITITVRHMISEVSHWHTFFISETFNTDKVIPLARKETDWHYKFGK
jgi:thiamine kinase-like enzyme